jgi:superfamily I DNA/RNA helicase
MADAGNVLYAFIGGNRKASDKLAALINMVDGTFYEWLEYIVSTFLPAIKVTVADDNAYMKAGKTWKDAMNELYYSGGLANNGAMDNIRRLYVASQGTPREFFLAVLDIYRVGMEWKYKADDSIRVFTGTVDAIKQLLTELPDVAISVLESMDKYKAPNKNYVTLSTAHSAKGREWDTVYIICDDVFAFPSQLSIDILSEAGDSRAVKRFIEAERRLHYVAMTRAKNKLHIVGGSVAPGRFLKEALEEDEAMYAGGVLE